MTGMNEEVSSNGLWLSVAFVLLLACLIAYLIVSDGGDLESEPQKTSEQLEQTEKLSQKWQADADGIDLLGAAVEARPNADALGVKVERANHPVSEREGNRTFYFDSVKVEEVLSNLSLSLDRGLVIDEQTRFALQYGMSLLPAGLTDEDLAELQAMIARVYPGEIGEKIADLVVAFYRLSEADSELDKSVSSARSHDETLDHVENIIELREHLLGKETAQKLFGNDLNDLMDAASFAAAIDEGKLQAKYGSNLGANDKDIASRRAGLELYLSGTDEAERQSVLELEDQVELIRRKGGSETEVYKLREAEFGEDAAGAMKVSEEIASAWENKYESYLEKKRYISEAGISEGDKRRQIVELLKTHYGTQDWLAAQAYDNERSERANLSNHRTN